MGREDTVTKSVKELRRVPVIRQAMGKQITPVKAGALLGLTTRQIRRLMQRVRQEGTGAWCIGGGESRRTGGSRRR
jgi:hypothetical protein